MRQQATSHTGAIASDRIGEDPAAGGRQGIAEPPLPSVGGTGAGARPLLDDDEPSLRAQIGDRRGRDDIGPRGSGERGLHRGAERRLDDQILIDATAP